MTDTLQTPGGELTGADAADIGAAWIADLAAALRSGSRSELAGLFHGEATWRDFMAFTWDFSHAIGRDGVVERLLELSEAVDARGFGVNGQQPPAVADGGIRVFFDFLTKDRIDRGYVHLVREPAGFVASVLQTQAEALQDHPAKVGDLRREGKVYGIVPGRTRWSGDRRREASFSDGDPAVLVLGAGHNGLTMAALLGALDVPTLVIDREARVGDTWRKRYAALALHSTVHGDHLPYLPFPPTWTAHTPKDKFADWLESYATLMDLNVWTGTEFLNGHYDDDTQRWTIRVRRADGTIRELRPRHFFVAGGLFAAPKIPEVKGLDTYTGLAVHSDAFQGGGEWEGRKALVVGAGVSGHEIAHDLYEHGTDVTLLQRSATYVLSYEAYHKLWNALFTEHADLPPEFADQIAYALPNTRSDDVNRKLVEIGAEHDRDLLDRLRARGFKLDWGPEGTGILGAHMSGKDSYHINIGAAELVADGKVHLKQGVEVTEIRDGRTVVFSDGSRMPDVDLIVFATGYHQFWGHIKPALGAAAAKIDKAYGRAADNEYANTWRRSAQPGLWFGTGFIRMARFYGKFSALLIKAIEAGIEPVDPDRPDAGNR
ncbi:SidA/IucD/PvdA family monooxygenase [Actinomadura sp. LD22]|uniref:SidA/IucD/PvdA family monooxygenase n=1 Tax=Actinomadura physcomitrii TaxID=2650748 RepID=A0A6I4MTW2_9ACTN|nr:NAD(P)/FAD-dependent oxidoreductase [Actinomadura physcomitrii]MWA07357.1 SidA/IucD/PvdA family monooxygenase [Actinomadura physcomitrii]